MHSFSLLHTITLVTTVEERPQYVAGIGPSHTCKEKNTTIKNTNTEQLNSLKMHSFSLLRTIM